MAVRIEAGSEPIPGYKLIERLGGGGFGEVWKAEAPGGLMKAIKVLYGDLQTTDPDGTRRAEQELKALKRVQSVRHPYLLSLERYDIIDNRLLIVMELAECNLWDRFRDCRAQNLQGIPRQELLRYMEESAEVLDLMNSQYGLQHLDIKPQNLFLMQQHAKVADFGLVKDLQGKMATVTGGITPVYAAPETFDGVVSRFCDQYSLAIVYQELLTGLRPFTGTSLQQLIMQHLTAQPNLVPLPKHDRTTIGKALSKKPEDRFSTCMEMVRALRAAEQTAAAAVSAPRPVAPARPAAVAAPARSPAAPPAPAVKPRPSSTPERPRPRPDTPASPDTPAAERPKPEPVIMAEENTSADHVLPAREAPPEVTGTGPLMPTVVIGLGQKGLEVLDQLSEVLKERFGSLDQVPHIRLIYLDTDADAVHAATHGGPGPTVAGHEAVLARLNRPSHYLKPATGKLAIGPWFNSKLLYRIPRNPTTTGLRPLGRLAFVDNYRLIAGKVRADLEAVTKPDALAAANRHTRLGIRTNRPRVHIVTGLAGGTGSGMFIDLAFVTRYLLKQLGYSKPDVIGHLFLPRADKAGKDMLATGNVFAALAELHHFSSPDTLFAAAYDDREGKFKDKDAPFAQVNLMLLEPDNESRRTGESTRLLGDLLARDLMTQLGRTVDGARVSGPEDNGKSRETQYHVLGVYRITWPRRILVQQSARLVCRQVAESWSTKEAGHLRETVKKWLTEELAKEEIGAEYMIAHLQAACKEALQQAPESAFAELVEPFLPRGKKVKVTEPDPQFVLETLEQMQELVGGPDDGGAMSHETNILGQALDQAVDNLVKPWGKKLGRLGIQLIEEPGYRLAGAEEGVRQLSSFIGQLLEHHEGLCHELAARAAEAHAQIHQLVAELMETRGTRRAAPVVANLIELLPLYPKYRYQSMVLRRMATVYTSLRGQLSDLTREIGFCRLRLNELVKAFEQAAQGDFAQALSAPAMYLLPTGSTTIEEAVQQLLDKLTAEEIKDLDVKTQAMISQHFQSLKEICLGSANQVKSLEQLMLQQAEAFIGARLVSNNVVEMFLTRYGQTDETDKLLAEFYEDATPKLAKYAAETEIRVLALPPGGAAELFKTHLIRTLPDAKPTLIDSPDDVVFYRERPVLQLDNLPHLGPPAEDAYRQILNSDPLTPHSRIDITDWLFLKKKEGQ